MLLESMPKTLKIFLVVALYWFVSITLVFVNKYILSDKVFPLKAPIFITWFQCVVTLFLCYSINILSRYKIIFKNVPDCPLNYKILKESLSLSIIFVGMIMFNNLCLKYVGISFYYIGRSLTTVFNVVFVYMILKQKTSLRILVCCAIIIGGFFLGVDQENIMGSFSLIGVIYGIAASACVALYSIYVKKLLPFVDDSIWRLTFYNNFIACLIFLPIILINGELFRFLTFPGLNDPKLWFMLTSSGFLGFAIGYVTGLQIQVTSPLTHNISGTAKAAFQTLLGVLWNHESKSFIWWLSNCIVLVGSMAYTHVRHLEMQSSKKKGLVTPGSKMSHPSSSYNMINGGMKSNILMDMRDIGYSEPDCEDNLNGDDIIEMEPLPEDLKKLLPSSSKK